MADDRIHEDGGGLFAADRGRESTPARIVHAGRSLISREQLARLSGLTSAEVTAVYARPAMANHPSGITIEPWPAAVFFDEELALRHYHCSSSSRNHR